jgi:hypothetical protein
VADKGQTKECQHTHVFIASSSQLFRLSADSSGVLVATTSPSIPKPVHKKKKQWFAVCFLGRGCAWGCCVHGLIMLPPQQWNQSHGCDDGSVVNMQSVFNQPSACIISRGVYFSGRAGAARRLARHLWPQLCTHSCVLASWTSLRPGIHLREST